MKTRYLYYILFAISLLIALFSYNTISKVYEKRTTIDTISQRIESLESENRRLQKDLEYKKTDEFVINEARIKLNYGFKDETTYIIPKELGSKKLDEDGEVPKEEQLSKLNKGYLDLYFSPNSGAPVYKLWLNAFLRL